MKIFLDTASVSAIKKLTETGLIDGVTTNPSHLSKEGGNPSKIVQEICAMLPHGAISVEVTEKKPSDVYKQAHAIVKMAENIVVKVPCHRDYYPVIKNLVQDGIQLNITLVFTLIQAVMMAKLGVAYVSPFIGRWEDIDIPAIDLLPQMKKAMENYGFKTQILAASLRTVPHIHEAMCANVDAITIPPELFEKASHHLLTDQGMILFDEAWKKLGISQFP